MIKARCKILLVLCSIGCASGDLPTMAYTPLGASGLVQEVSLSATTVGVGDSITIRSVVRNSGAHSEIVGIGEIGGCGDHGLAVSGVTFAGRPDTLPCAGLMAEVSLAPGDSVNGATTTAPIESPPGDYVITIQQVRRPTAAAKVHIRIVPRAAT